MQLMRRPERGFSMIVVMGVMLICMLLSAAAFATVNGDMPLRKQSRERKQAFAAAEAGLNFYLSRLNQDNAYWARCTNVARPNAQEQSPVNQIWNGSGADPRKWRAVPGAAANYTIELMPAAGASACDPARSSATMLDPATGTMRIRATGIAGAQKRSLIATMRRKSFLDYVYFTDYETMDPVTSQWPEWAATACRRYRASRSSYCEEIRFASQDDINGPFHTNDDVLTCGATTFGRTEADRLEASGPAPGWHSASGCGTTAPDFRSTWQAGVPPLAVPSSNVAITSVAVAPYILTGTQDITLNGSTNTMTILGSEKKAKPYTLPWPANGVLWIRGGSGCGTGGNPRYQDYNEPKGCANVRVSGTYSQGLTLVSDKDVIVDGNISRGTSDALLGLIATDFVRIYHPVKNRDVNYYGVTTSCDNNGTPTNISIDAAILSLEHSFIVDNYDCGGQLGTLTVKGAIAQRFRGPVGTSGGYGTGYLKNYLYDDRLKYRNPPFFLDPVAAAWRLLRMNEQVPAR